MAFRRLSWVALLLFGTACSSQNPAPVNPGTAGTGTTPAAATVVQPQAPTAPATLPALDRERCNCQVFAEKCANVAVEDLSDECKACQEQIEGCSEDMSAEGTVYRSDLRGVPMSGGSGYGFNNLYPGTRPFAGGGYSPFGRPGGGYRPYAGGGMIPYRSNWFQGNAGLSRAYCGQSYYSEECTETVVTEHFHRCRRVISAMDDAAYQLERGESPRQVYMTLARVKPMADEAAGGTSLGEAFTGLLDELRKVPSEIATGVTIGLANTVRGVGQMAVRKGAGLLTAPAYRAMNQMRYMAGGFNYLGYQRDGRDVCASVQETTVEYRSVCTCTYYEQTYCR